VSGAEGPLREGERVDVVVDEGGQPEALGEPGAEARPASSGTWSASPPIRPPDGSTTAGTPRPIPRSSSFSSRRAPGSTRSARRGSRRRSRVRVVGRRARFGQHGAVGATRPATLVVPPTSTPMTALNQAALRARRRAAARGPPTARRRPRPPRRGRSTRTTRESGRARRGFGGAGPSPAGSCRRRKKVVEPVPSALAGGLHPVDDVPDEAQVEPECAAGAPLTLAKVVSRPNRSNSRNR